METRVLKKKKKNYIFFVMLKIREFPSPTPPKEMEKLFDSIYTAK